MYYTAVGVGAMVSQTAARTLMERASKLYMYIRIVLRHENANSQPKADSHAASPSTPTERRGACMQRVSPHALHGLPGACASGPSPNNRKWTLWYTTAIAAAACTSVLETPRHVQRLPTSFAPHSMIHQANSKSSHAAVQQPLKCTARLARKKRNTAPGICRALYTGFPTTTGQPETLAGAPVSLTPLQMFCLPSWRLKPRFSTTPPQRARAWQRLTDLLLLPHALPIT